MKKLLVLLVLTAPYLSKAQVLTEFAPLQISTVMAQTLDELSALLVTVLENHPTLKSKKSDLNAARLGVTVAERQFWPTPSISNEVGPVNTQGLSSATTARLSYPVFTGGQLSADLEIADLRYRLSSAEIGIASRELGLQFIDLYRAWWLHCARIGTLRAALTQMDQLRQMLARRTQAGISSQLDLTQADIQLQRMQDDYRLAVKQRDQILADMVTFAGQNLQPQFRSLDNWPKSPHTKLGDVMDRVLATHPSITSSQWQAKLAQTEVKRAKASSLPSVSFRVEQQHGSYLGAQASGSRAYLSSQFTLGAGLAALPVQEQALARATAAELQTNTHRLNLSAQVQRVWHERTQAAEQINSISRQLKSQKELTDAGMRLFTAGRRSWQDLLGLQRDLYLLLSQQNEAESAYLGADWRLHLLANTLPQFSFPAF